jgi:aspartyl-tRNA(Asn)/glutamyl-tRNA(Gln) amidotransferase subunit A
MSSKSRRKFLKNSAVLAAGLAVGCRVKQIPTDYTYISISKLGELIRQGKVSPVTITKTCLKRIEQLNPRFNAFITVTAETALAEAAIAEKEIKEGKWRGPLHGIPISYKDNIDTAGIKTTAASAVFKDRIPTEDAAVVKKLKVAGAVCVGKTNMHEFALGTTSLISFYGPVRNPWNTEYIAGGSSGGSAAAVAAGMCYASIGTDTGGSCRLPPACCGITGFKATHGSVSLNGIIPVSISYDHVCPICRTAEDAAILLGIMAEQTRDYRGSFAGNKNFTIGIPKQYKASEEVEHIFRKAIAVFTSMGYNTISIDLPVETAGPAVFSFELESVHGPLIEKFKDRYDPVTLADIKGEIKGFTAAEYAAEKIKMENDRKSISAILFKGCDVVMLPVTTTITPTIIAAGKAGPFALEGINTEPFSSFGLPAISIPCGFSSNNMPLGLQIVGPRFGEDIVLYAAAKYEKATGWHLKHPPVS